MNGALALVVVVTIVAGPELVVLGMAARHQSRRARHRGDGRVRGLRLAR